MKQEGHLEQKSVPQLFLGSLIGTRRSAIRELKVARLDFFGGIPPKFEH